MGPSAFAHPTKDYYSSSPMYDRPSLPIEIPSRRQPSNLIPEEAASPELIFMMSPLDKPSVPLLSAPLTSFNAMSTRTQIGQDNLKSIIQRDAVEDPFLYPFPVLSANAAPAPSLARNPDVDFLVSPDDKGDPFTTLQPRREPFPTIVNPLHDTRNPAAHEIIAGSRVPGKRNITSCTSPWAPALFRSPAATGSSGSSIKPALSPNSEPGPSRFEDHLLRQIDNQRFHQVHQAQPISSMSVSICG